MFRVVSLQYNIKKREEVQELTQEEPNPLMRKKKTPEELAAEAEAEEEDEITSTYPQLVALKHHTGYRTLPKGLGRRIVERS